MSLWLIIASSILIPIRFQPIWSTKVPTSLAFITSFISEMQPIIFSLNLNPFAQPKASRFTTLSSLVMAYLRSLEKLALEIGCWNRLCTASVRQQRRLIFTTFVLFWYCYFGSALPSAAKCELVINWPNAALIHASDLNIESFNHFLVFCFCRYSLGCD